MSWRGKIDMMLEILENLGGAEDLPKVQRVVEKLIVARQENRTIDFSTVETIEAQRQCRDDEARRGTKSGLR